MAFCKETSYETVTFPDSELPVIFHYDKLRDPSDFMMHWQDSPELLYFTEGEAEVVSDARKEIFHPGDIAVINCTHLHEVKPVGAGCGYYCLIVERDFLERQGLPVGGMRLALRVRDNRMRESFDLLVHELMTREPFYQTVAKANILTLFACLCRHYAEERSPEETAQDRRLAMVKTALRYIQNHFAEELTVESISAAAGFSKYYFCRGFREVTGRTVVDYLNLIRCSHARRLLASGKYNVSESAERSGFRNLSYFARTYRRYMGVLPSWEENGGF